MNTIRADYAACGERVSWKVHCDTIMIGAGLADTFLAAKNAAAQVISQYRANVGAVMRGLSEFAGETLTEDLFARITARTIALVAILGQLT